MSTHKYIDRICVAVLAFTLLVTVLFMNGGALGLQASSRILGYEKTLFDTSKVHNVEIMIDDWDEFLATCESEEYSVCTVVIDNEAVKNVAIRGKGNTSLSTVKTMGSRRYSFKIEFDHYESGKSYHGLDKLSLNNIIQDNTYMKDYLSYRLMAEFGVDAPLCSFVYITVNGDAWGLYLAVEGVEDSFLRRSYGSDTGELYKPDSMSFGGGGPGNGGGFHMEGFLNYDTELDGAEGNAGSDTTSIFGGVGNGNMPGGSVAPPHPGSEAGNGGFPGGNMPEGLSPPRFGGNDSGEVPNIGADVEKSRGGFDFGRVFDGMGSGDVKLQYIDDDPSSYSNIFNNAKTDVSPADQSRLIEALKQLSNCEGLENAVDVDEVIRYFVVHNYVCNGDSYTGSIVHNYYLHERNGQLSMIPWDYNLAFGTFQNSDATGTVNDPIDTPMSVSDAAERPMCGWIQSSETYTQMYHQYFADFLDTVDISGIIEEAYALIRPYVEKDPTAFCTFEEFELGVTTLRAFCTLRAESVRGQLDGTIPSTAAGQRTDSAALIDASALTLSDMGSMGGGRGGIGAGAFEGTLPSREGDEGAGFSAPSNGEAGAPPQQGGDAGTAPPTQPGGTETDSRGSPPPGPDSSRGRPDFSGDNATRPESTRTGASNYAAPTAFNREVWVLLGVSALTLIVGILVAKRYKKH